MNTLFPVIFFLGGGVNEYGTLAIPCHYWHIHPRLFFFLNMDPPMNELHFLEISKFQQRKINVRNISMDFYLSPLTMCQWK